MKDFNNVEEELEPIRRKKRVEEMPHYWPADKVPYLPITYC